MLDAETKASLMKDLVKLADMMGDGLHLEPDGKWISKEYSKIFNTLYPGVKNKHKNEVINGKMSLLVSKNKCVKCGGGLKQVRKNSKIAKCLECPAKYKMTAKHNNIKGKEATK